jgi:peptide/nickel transport system substrate-binding protein
VREAFNLSVDKKAIQRVVMEGLSFPTAMITPPGVLGNTPELDESYGFDLDRAKSLMADAGYGDGFEIQLDCPNNRYNNDEKICQAAVAMLAKIGVKVKLDAIPKAQHFPKIQKRVTDFYMLGWGVSTLDSHYVFSYLIESKGSWNGTGYSNARVDEITKMIASETDIPKRTALIDEAWTIVKSEMPYVPIHHQVLAWGMSDNIDIPISSDDRLRPRFVVMK